MILVYLVGVVAAGLLAGTLWHLLTVPPNFTIGDDQGAIITERGLSQVFALDIWYIFIGIAFGLGLGVFSWGLLRKLGWPLVLVTIAAALLAGLICWRFGNLLGPRDFADRIAAAQPGDRVPMDLDLHSATLLVIWPLAADLPVLLLALWNQIRPAHR